jgi:predicted dehydrogenase
MLGCWLAEMIANWSASSIRFWMVLQRLLRHMVVNRIANPKTLSVELMQQLWQHRQGFMRRLPYLSWRQALICLLKSQSPPQVEDARAIVVTARRYGRVVAVGHVERFNPAWALACQQPGRPLFIQAARLAPFTYRSLDVGVVFDLMIHDIDLVLSLQPGRLENIESNGIVATGGHEDVVKARLTFGSGLVADLMASRINPVLSRELSMWTSEAMVSVDFNAKTVGVVAASEEVAAGKFIAESVPVGERANAKDAFFQDVLPHQALPVPDSNAIASEHDDFLRARAEGVDPRVSASAGSAALEVATRVLDVLRCTKLGAPPAIMEIRKSA